MLKITLNDLLQNPETKRLTVLGRLTTIFDVIISDSIGKLQKTNVIIYNKSQCQIQNVDTGTVMPNDYATFHCFQIVETDKQSRSTGCLFV